MYADLHQETALNGLRSVSLSKARHLRSIKIKAKELTRTCGEVAA